jgi:guanosine-3',5'-bis(diphosphate) 3'-pyrophosphohydrolase
MTIASPISGVLQALHFAAHKHRDQRRKGAEASPYINHLIEAAELLSGVGGVSDLPTLQAAILHDTLEDTTTTPEELDKVFGPEVCRIVEELTDDQSLSSDKRKQKQIDYAPRLSTRAKMIKIVDKISNIRSIVETPPTKWSLARKREYLAWSERVVAGCRGSNEALERLFDDRVMAAKASLG